jgi:hypothetical protein
MKTARMAIVRTGTALLLACGLLAGCTGEPSDTTSGTAQPSSTPTAAAAGIPNGTWVREVTTGEIASRGLTLSAEEITSNYLDDGAAQLVLKTQGTRWALLVQDNAGEFEMGDLGESSYDEQGRWLQSSDATGDSLMLMWDVAGDTLTTSDLTTTSGRPIYDAGAQIFLVGTWQRQG